MSWSYDVISQVHIGNSEEPDLGTAFRKKFDTLDFQCWCVFVQIVLQSYWCASQKWRWGNQWSISWRHVSIEGLCSVILRCLWEGSLEEQHTHKIRQITSRKKNGFYDSRTFSRFMKQFLTSHLNNNISSMIPEREISLRISKRDGTKLCCMPVKYQGKYVVEISSWEHVNLFSFKQYQECSIMKLIEIECQPIKNWRLWSEKRMNQMIRTRKFEVWNERIETGIFVRSQQGRNVSVEKRMRDVFSNKKTDDVQEEILAVLATGGIVDNKHNRFLFQRHRPGLTEESFPKALTLREKFLLLSKITKLVKVTPKGNCTTKSCNCWHLPACENFKLELGLKFNDESLFSHTEADMQANEISQKSDVKGSVALLKESIQSGCVFQDVGRPKKSDKLHRQIFQVHVTQHINSGTKGSVASSCSKVWRSRDAIRVREDLRMTHFRKPRHQERLRPQRSQAFDQKWLQVQPKAQSHVPLPPKHW